MILLDCYTDEPSGLGVPPYLGVYPRYIAGYFENEGTKYKYMTIDDLRVLLKYGKVKDPKPSEKTNIAANNFSKNKISISELKKEKIVAVVGVHTPGKYLSAQPGTIKEVERLLEGYDLTITGPGIYGSQMQGGKKAEITKFKTWDSNFSFKEIKKYSILGAGLIDQIKGDRIIEIESARGCPHGKCSFCIEPLKNRFEYRDNEDIYDEMKTLYNRGVRNFRLGKQSCFYSLPDPSGLLKRVKSIGEMEVLHIDNVNPKMVLGKRGEKITKDIVKYCTSGNIAAFGVESFDNDISKENTLNTNAEESYEAIQIINEYGREVGDNGMPKYLPGINILFGLIGETKKTHEENMKWMQKIFDNNLLLRRINIREVALMPGTRISEVGSRVKKNKKYYWKWRNEIRQKIDVPMLPKIVPKGTVMKDVYMEIYDGKKTFGRQLGSYPLIVGLEKRVELKKYDIKVKGHMKRSIIGEM